MRKEKFLEKVLTARVYDVARETPLDFMPRISKRFGNKVYLKREDLQPVFSFKCRGAFNKIYQELQANPKLKGVITASAGNHAQGVALAAKKLHLSATIVMPTTTPDIKVSAVRSYGAKAVLYGENFDAAKDYCLKLAKKEKLAFIHPFDDFDVMAGQGTIAHEIIRQHPDRIDAIFVAVGGGGLIAGIAGFMKAVKPETKIIAVEPDDAGCFYEARKAGRRVILKDVGIFADGVAVRQVGKNTYSMIKDLVDDVILVSTDQICAAIKDTYEDTRSICEPAGALSLAGLKKYVEEHDIEGQTFIAINCGANMNFDRLRHVSERAELGEDREALLAVEIPERPGSFKRLCRLIGHRSITEFNYRYADEKIARVFAGIQLTHGIEEKNQLIEKLRSKGYMVVDMTGNEVAKLHTRYMIGGHPGGSVSNEYLYRFQFPEKPGALLNFLMQVGDRWNISLFHYRNHGSNFGRILMGFQVNRPDIRVFNAFLKGLNIPYWDETDNEAYQLFLK
ncbi:MAG: threonine ammonia-lyase, biosynthetic [Gammaproteobacteria bacterium]|nr:threonine ammonia-lyase, biosynthetic [Gammaproteobacteria bacterium]MDH3450400.1 threonine ammonia-lyase, biosynthetic [Gammaproteobacteria bacterium]